MGSTGGVTSDTLSAIAPRNAIASTGTVMSSAVSASLPVRSIDSGSAISGVSALGDCVSSDMLGVDVVAVGGVVVGVCASPPPNSPLMDSRSALNGLSNAPANAPASAFDNADDNVLVSDPTKLSNSFEMRDASPLPLDSNRSLRCIASSMVRSRRRSRSSSKRDKRTAKSSLSALILSRNDPAAFAHFFRSHADPPPVPVLQVPVFGVAAGQADGRGPQ